MSFTICTFNGQDDANPEAQVRTTIVQKLATPLEEVCPLWITRGHFLPPSAMSALGRKRTRTITQRSGSIAATRGKITLISVNRPGCDLD